MKKKTLLLVLLLAAVLGIAYGAYLWNKPKRTAEGETAVASLSASELFAAFETDVQAANTNYIDKVVEVTGTVATADRSDSGILILTLETSNPMAAVTCTFTPGNDSRAEAGQTIRVKGICSGLQGDMLPAVVLSQCTEINP
jgi:hypothetical protein